MRRIIRYIYIITLFSVLFGSACGPFPDSPDSDQEDGGNSTDIDLPEGPISNVSLEIHPLVETILVVNWTQDEAADTAWIEFTFENDEWFASPKKSGGIGDHSEVVLGVPETTEITIRIANETGESIFRTDSFQGTNGNIPEDMPRPTLIDHAPTLASHHRWLLGSVENTATINGYWESPYYAFIIDREARIVWYYRDPLESRILFARVAPEGTHITFDESFGFIFDGTDVRINRATLDLEYLEQVKMEEMTWGHDITSDGNILFDEFGILKEMDPSGNIDIVWDCQEWLPTSGWPGHWSDCFSNTVSWSPARNSVNLSLPWYVNSVLEIDLPSRQLKSVWGAHPLSWEFDPEDVAFEFQHFPNITDEGTLLVSSHVPGVSNQQNIMEFEIDDDNQVLRLIWSYGEGIGSYADQSGEATRISNGNTLVNYGTGGTVREVTPDKATAWHVLFDADFPSETENKLLGHTTLVDNLYDLNQEQ